MRSDPSTSELLTQDGGAFVQRCTQIRKTAKLVWQTIATNEFEPKALEEAHVPEHREHNCGRAAARHKFIQPCDRESGTYALASVRGVHRETVQVAAVANLPDSSAPDDKAVLLGDEVLRRPNGAFRTSRQAIQRPDSSYIESVRVTDHVL